MHNAQVGGVVGPLHDPASGQQVTGSAQGSFAFTYAGDPNQVTAHVQAGILRAATQIIQQKLNTNQVALPTLAVSLPHFIPEIVAASGAASMGVQVTQLTLNVTVQPPALAPAPFTGPLPPTPQQAMMSSLQQHAQEKLDPRNYEVEAQVNIGGFKLKGSTDKGFDSEGLKNQVVDKAKSTVIWWGIGCAIVGLVGLLLVGLGGYIWWSVASDSPAVASGPSKTVTWDGKSPFKCGGNDSQRIENVTASVSGTAISAAGNCRLELVNCSITATTGIQASANAVVTVTGGSITGSTHAASALGNSKIKFVGTKVTGKTQATGGKIEGP